MGLNQQSRPTIKISRYSMSRYRGQPRFRGGCWNPGDRRQSRERLARSGVSFLSSRAGLARAVLFAIIHHVSPTALNLDFAKPIEAIVLRRLPTTRPVFFLSYHLCLHSCDWNSFSFLLDHRNEWEMEI